MDVASRATAILIAGLFGLGVVAYLVKRKSESTLSKCTCCPCTGREHTKHGLCYGGVRATCRHCQKQCCYKCSNYNSYKSYHSHRICPPR